MLKFSKRTFLNAFLVFLCFFALLGCTNDNLVNRISAGPSFPTPSAPSTTGAVSSAKAIYKPFASEHNDKFSLGDFDSLYLIELLGELANFVASNSSILLNGESYEVTKSNYQGNIYVSLTNFSFYDYIRFVSNNTKLDIQLNLMGVDGVQLTTNEMIASDLAVTGFTNIYTWQDLQGMKHALDGKYVLRNDIDFPARGSEGLEVVGFEPIGNYDNPFTGSFAGNHHRIDNLSIARFEEDYVGMWGYVNSPNSVIKDFVLNHIGIDGGTSVGGVVGGLSAGMVSNVGMISTRGASVVGSGAIVGGLVGENIPQDNSTGNRGTVIGYSTGAVRGDQEVGGLVGWNFGTVIGYVTGAVRGDTVVGGLVGWNLDYSSSDIPIPSIVIGYVTGEVHGETQVGGLVGRSGHHGETTGYATGEVHGDTRVGGLVGYVEKRSRAVNGYWDKEGTKQRKSVGEKDENFVNDNGVVISEIAKVDFSSGIYMDSENGSQVFTNENFLRHFTPTGASGEWPDLKMESYFLSP